MKKGSTLFLQLVLVLIGAGILAWLLWFPHLEGVNANATTLSEVYFDDPFLAYIYAVSILFFVGLYQGIKILGYAGDNKVISQGAVNALRKIRYCALLFACAIVAADTFLMIAARTNGEDSAGAVMLGLIITFLSIVIAATAGVFERILQNAVDIKSENDLTV